MANAGVNVRKGGTIFTGDEVLTGKATLNRMQKIRDLKVLYT